MYAMIAESLSLRYGEKLLFDDLSLIINIGDKAGLIAPNGSGKTTLMKQLAGKAPATGEIRRARNKRISYLPQDPDFPSDQTIEEGLLNGDHPALMAYKRYKLDPSPENSALMDKYHAWNISSKMQKLISDLALPEIETEIASLSGGQKKRVALARLILTEPDILLLDEPTNHLDLEMIEWLEDYLSSPSLTILMVTHDRFFLDRICTHIYELENGQLDKYTGGYTDYLEKKNIKMEAESSFHQKQQKLLKKELAWAKRQPKARTSKSKARVNSAYELKEELQKNEGKEEADFSINTRRIGSKVIEMLNVSKSFDDRDILKNFTYKLTKKNKIGIAGKNGSGKSTFLNVMLKKLRPDAGKVIHGDTLEVGYFRQGGLNADEHLSVLEVIRSHGDYIPLKKGGKITAERLAERFLFDASKQRVRISELSGGEKRRLYLLTILIKNPNMLVMDEPTNDLDISTLQVLEDYLLDFPGVLVTVSHDRYFLNKVTEKLFIMPGNGQVIDFPGTYEEYRSSHKETSIESRSIEKTRGKLQYDEEKKRKREIESIEKKLRKLEEEKSSIAQQYEEESLTSDKMEELSKRSGEIQKQINELEAKWMELI